MADGFRFRSQHRLLCTADYDKVFGQRRVFRGALLDLHVGPGSAGEARLGLVIPKRNAALAVTRNYCKRVAREFFRHHRAELPPMDLVLRLARPIKEISRESLGRALRQDFDKLFKRLPR